MITISGINVIPGQGASPSLYDIGYSLSQVPRFGGHTKYPWSNLQHLFLCQKYAKARSLGVEVEIYALLHDAHESVTGDISHPWKTDDMRAYQRELDHRIFSNLGLPDMPEAVQVQVKQIDQQALHAEASFLGVRNLGPYDSFVADIIQQMQQLDQFAFDTHQKANQFTILANRLIREYNDAR